MDHHGKPVSIGFLYPHDAYKVRDLSKKSFHSIGDLPKAGLFGRNLFDPGSYKSVIITEGEADALACWQVLRVPSVSVQSSTTGHRDCTLDHSWLAAFDRIYLALDGDAKGKSATADIAKLFPREKLFHVKWGRHKDALGYLENGEEAELASIWNNSKNYLPEHTISSLADFRTILKQEAKPGIPYPFRQLQEMTYGIRGGESILVTAFEGVGKTEFLHTLEYSILTSPQRYRIGAIFLEETPRRHLEALASIHLKMPVHLPDTNCSQDQINSAIQEILGQDDRLFLDTRFGSCDVRELNDHIRFLVHGCGCNIIMLDHANMAVGRGSRDADERKDLDELFTEQEMMVKELDYSFIVVSHVNDFGQTRGSRWGSKMADTRIDLSREIGSNVLRIDVSKNRFGGRTGHAGNYLFDTFTRNYSEVVANDNEQTKGQVAQAEAA